MPDSDEPPREDLPATARALEDKLRSLQNLDLAIRKEIARANEAAARQLARIARDHALAALEAAAECVTLPHDERGRLSADAIRHAEETLDIAPGTFSSFFAVDLDPGDRAGRKALTDLLAEVRRDIANNPVVADVRTVPSWLPAVVRIGSAVLVGAAVGAPLGALAVGESVVAEIVKAGIAVTACAVAAEVTNQVLQRWLRPPEPAEPPVPAHPHYRVWSLRDLTDDAEPELGAPLALAEPAHQEPTLPTPDPAEPDDLPTPDPPEPDDLPTPDPPEPDDLPTPDPPEPDDLPTPDPPEPDDLPTPDPPEPDDLDEPFSGFDL